MAFGGLPYADPRYGTSYGYATEYIPEQYEQVDWTNYYVTTPAGNLGRRRRPVIYIAAPMPAMPFGPRFF